MDSICLLNTSVLPVTNTPKRPQVDHEIRTPPREETNKPKEDPKPKFAVERLIAKMPIVDEYFIVHKKIGEGTFSNVFVATCKLLSEKKKFAIKHLTPTSHPSRIIQEMKCLQDIGGQDNVVGLELCLRHKDSVAFVMPYFPYDPFSKYVTEMGPHETQLYMKNLLIALRRVHSFDVIHRDVKPSNFLYNRREQKFLLVDFGLSHKVENSRYHSNTSIVGCSKVNRKRPLDEDKETISNEPKRPVLLSLSNNVPECSDRQPAKQSLKKKSPLFKENSPASKNATLNRNISQVKRNLQFGNIATEAKKDVMPLLAKNPGFNFNVAGSSFFRVQNSQIKSQVVFGALEQGSFRKPIPKTYVNQNEHCGCDKKPRICNACILRKPMHAPRAGTPGYRSPEVLLKYPYQTTAVDIWSAGIIMLSIMSGSYPFFRAPDDITALMEMITVFGTNEMRNTAFKLGRYLSTNEERKPLKLSKLCEVLRRRSHDREVNVQEVCKILENKEISEIKPEEKAKVNSCYSCFQKVVPAEGCLCNDHTAKNNTNEESGPRTTDDQVFPKEAYDLLSKLLSVDPERRITAEAALRHPFFQMDFFKDVSS